MAPLTQIQKAVYANQTMAMERESVLRAARVVAKARKELLAKVQAAPKTTSIQQATLSSLDAVLKTLPQDIMKALRTDELVEKGYRQGRSLLLEVAKGTDAEGKLSGFAGILDLRTYSQDANQAVAQIRGLSEQAKAQIKASAEVSLALGEGEVDTMRRLFGDIDKPGDKTPFRSLKISAERIARTVTNSLVNSGKSSAYQQYANEFPELGILNEWVNVTDFRTSDTCRALVGQKRPPGQAFQGGGFSGFHPPAHPNCRSTIIPTIGEPVEPVQPIQPEPTPQPIEGVRPNTPKVTLEGQIKKGGEFVAAVLSRGEVSRLTKMSKDFHRDMDLYFNKGDGEAFERIRAAVKDVAPLATKLKEALEAQNSEGLNIKTGYSRKNGVVGEAESIDWTDQTGKTHKVKLDSSLNDHPQAFRMSGLVKDVVKLTGGSSLEGATLVYLDQNRGKSPSRDRGWAEHATKTINVGGKQGRDLGSTMLHETAHFIEYDVPGAKEASMELIKRRATGPVMSLADVDPVYRDDELFMPDEFVSPYVGKIYPGSSPGTEVLSIGLQHLVTPELTAEFMLRDPEHFNYALSYLVKKIPQPAPEPVKVKAPTFDEYLKSLPKSEQKWLNDYLQKVEEDYWLTAGIGDLEAPGKLMDKWKAVYAKSAHTLAQTPKVKVISDKGGLKEHQESFEMFGHNVTMTLAKPFDWNAFTGRETNEPPEFPKVSVVFVTDGGFNPKINDPKEAMAIASEVKKRLNAAMAEMPDGTVMVNEPVGGTLGKRAFIYSMQGWGPCGPDGKQYAVIKDGKAVPLSLRDYEKLQKTGEI